jgi:methanethiol S-methyltransferase
MGKVIGFVYGIVAYLLFLVTFVYAIGFVGNFGVPKALDGPTDGPWMRAALADLGLLTLFALQHSGMARQPFKRWLTRIISPTVERSTYVLASSITLAALMFLWQPLGGIVWDIRNSMGQVVLFGGFALGWTLVLVSTFQQVWRNLFGRPPTSSKFATPIFYQFVRHPLYAGFLLAFWCTPKMTATHLLFAAMTSVYILAAIQLEERDLLRAHTEYAAYRARVPMLIPSRRSPSVGK